MYRNFKRYSQCGGSTLLMAALYLKPRLGRFSPTPRCLSLDEFPDQGLAEGYSTYANLDMDMPEGWGFAYYGKG